MSIYEDVRMLAIGEVGSAPINKKSNYILNFANNLSGVDFICVDEKHGHDVVTPIRDIFKFKTGNLTSVFHSDKLRVFNIDFILGSKTRFYYSYEIFLDTQIVSYIDKFSEDKLDDHLKDVIKPLQVKREIQSVINFMPYVLENCIKKGHFNKIEYKNVLHLLTFLNIPITTKVKSKKLAKKQAKILKAKFFRDDAVIGVYTERYFYMYCMLLQIICLYFENCSIKNKLVKLIEFENNRTYTMDVMYINIAIEFWSKGTTLPFFSKIQRNKLNILDIIKNMAWDIYHWFNTINGFIYKQCDICDINFSLFYTIDKRFLELSKYIKLNCLAVDKIHGATYPFFETQKINNILSLEEQQKFFNTETLHIRNKFRNTKVDTITICKELEQKLLQYAF